MLEKLILGILSSNEKLCLGGGAPKEMDITSIDGLGMLPSIFRTVSISGYLNPNQLLLGKGGVHPEQFTSLLQGHTHRPFKITSLPIKQVFELWRKL